MHVIGYRMVCVSLGRIESVCFGVSSPENREFGTYIEHDDGQPISSRCPSRRSNRLGLALEVPPVFGIDQDEVEVIPDGKLLVDVPERRCQVESSQKEPDRDRLACGIARQGDE